MTLLEKDHYISKEYFKKHKNENQQFIKLTSGPNHFNDYFPIYTLVEIAMLKHENSNILGKNILSLEEYISHDIECIFEELDDMIISNDFGIGENAKVVKTYIENVIKEYLP